MQLPTIALAAAALFSSIALAAPTAGEAHVKRQTYPSVPMTFYGAGGAYYTKSVVANNVPVTIEEDLSVTDISMEGRASFSCNAHGIDGSSTTLVGNQVRSQFFSSFLLI